MIAIVVSRADYASEHIGERLLERAEWTERDDPSRPDADGGGTYYRRTGFELRRFDELHIRLDDPAPAFEADPDLLVFVSRHSGDTGPLLSAHVTGNFGPAEYGGADGELARACPHAQKTVLAALDRRAPAGYDVAAECTHHGPTALDTPSMFVELGSDDPQWKDPEGAAAVADAVLDLEGVDADRRVRSDEPNRHVVGFGGGHYAPRFTRIARETTWAVGHIGAEWQLAAMGSPEENRDVVAAAFERSAAACAVVDGTHPALEAVIDDLGYRVASETWVREVDDRPLALVETLEAELATVDEGLRFGDETATDGLAVASLPDDLLTTAAGVDADRTRRAVAAETIAFETTEGGTLPTGRAAVASRDALDALVDALAEIIRDKYDAVRREGDAVVATDAGFDPGKAATLGVPEGPAFGKLAAGEAVDVGGRHITPEAVTTEQTIRFSTGGKPEFIPVDDR
ncbi:D-aminoacyl-tRNA deacylase [Haloferacaceae archaeon DSL9]